MDFLQQCENIHDLKICNFAATTDPDGEVYIYLTKDEKSLVTAVNSF
jgi:hypothetical protein